MDLNKEDTSMTLRRFIDENIIANEEDSRRLDAVDEQMRKTETRIIPGGALVFGAIFSAVILIVLGGLYTLIKLALPVIRSFLNSL